MCRSPEMSRWHIDNLMTHIAAAALTVDDYEVDVNDLRDDLKLENKEYVSQELTSYLVLMLHRIKQYFAELGCKLNPPTQAELTRMKLTRAESTNHTIAKLKLPLSFPKIGGARAKRRA
jgi:DNA-directed RNA polymerase I subunit RPA49